MTHKNPKVLICGATGLVGSAILRHLLDKGYSNIAATHHSRPPWESKTGQIQWYRVDLTSQESTTRLFSDLKPSHVYLAAAKVGGILANSTYPADFIRINLAIETNVIHQAHIHKVRKLLFLGSSCIYPRLAPQPMKEEYLLDGKLESTNEAYAIAKIAGIKMCSAYNRQYGTDFLSVMPTNLYGPNDNFDLENSHVLPALIRKFHLARLLSRGNFHLIQKDLATFGNPVPESLPNHPINPEALESHLAVFGIYPDRVALWGTGTPRREFLHVDDLAEACVYLMENHTSGDLGEFVNIGTGEDLTIKDLAKKVKTIVGFQGEIFWDTSKPEGTPRKLLDISKIKSLGWSPKTSLEEGIRKTYQWYLERLT